MKKFAVTISMLLVMSAQGWAQSVAPNLSEAQVAQSKQRAKQLADSIKQNIKIPVTPFGPLTAGNTFRYYGPKQNEDPLAALQVAPGTWWNNSNTAARLGLTKDQQKKMDDIFQQFRLKLIDLTASLSKEELIMTPLISADRLDEAKLLAQIDRIAQARAELEKANARMLLGIRQSLTMEQWSKIQAAPFAPFADSLNLRLNGSPNQK